MFFECFDENVFDARSYDMEYLPSIFAGKILDIESLI